MSTVTNNFNADEKILKYVDKLDYFFNSHKTLIVVEFDLTNKCNNRCPKCCGINENNKELNKEQIDNIIYGLNALECKGAILSGGGEPLISPYYEYALKKLRNCGIKCGVNSNGLALNEKLSYLIAENCEYLRISLDAATPEIYKLTHGMDEKCFNQTLENIKNFARIKKEIGSSTSFGVGFLTSKDTERDMEGFVKLTRDLGVDFAQFRPFTEDMLDITEKYNELKEKYETDDFKVRASMQKYREMGTLGERPYNKCSGMFFSTVITANAKVFACLHHRQDDKYFLGDITDKDSLENIFRSARMREVYESIDCSKCPPLCRNDVFNRTLNTLSLDVGHKEFL